MKKSWVGRRGSSCDIGNSCSEILRDDLHRDVIGIVAWRLSSDALYDEFGPTWLGDPA